MLEKEEIMDSFEGILTENRRNQVLEDYQGLRESLEEGLRKKKLWTRSQKKSGDIFGQRIQNLLKTHTSHKV